MSEQPPKEWLNALKYNVAKCDADAMSKPNKPTFPKPWLVVFKAGYPGAFPGRIYCHICDIDYRPQSINTAARFLKSHRRCGHFK